MRSLPLYPETPKLAIEKASPLDLNSSCIRCPHSRGAMHVCLPAGGRPGGLLVVGDHPTDIDDKMGAPFMGDAARYVRGEISKRWTGPVVYDNALRCKPTETQEPEYIDACRPYLAGTYREGKFERVLCLGASAFLAVIGRSAAPLSVRKGYAYASDGTPVFLLMPAGAARRNRHLRVQFEGDLQWALTANPPKQPTDAIYHVIETLDDAERAAEALRIGYAYDLEWMGHLWDDRFVILAVSCSPYGTDDCYTWNGRAKNVTELWAPLKRIMEDPEIPKGGWNVKSDVAALAAGLDIDVQGTDADGMIWRRQLDSEVFVRLDYAQELVGMGGGKADIELSLKQARAAIQHARKNAWHPTFPGFVEDWIEMATRRPQADPDTFAYGGVPTEQLLQYNARDAVSTSRAIMQMRPKVQAKDYVRKTWDVFLRPTIRTLTRIEKHGMLLDLDAFDVFERYLNTEIERVESGLFQYGTFNPDSDPELRTFLFDKLRLPITKRTKKTQMPSVDAEVLAALVKKHPAVAFIGERRGIVNMRSKSLRQYVRADGRVHTRYTLGYVRSQRLSSTEPNLQNQASRNKKLAKMLKDCFIAAPGYVIISLDYGQIEYRVAAILSKDPVFRQVFLDGHDLHLRTAQMIAPHVWGIKPADVKPEHRYLAKNVNFGVLFGMAIASLAKFIGVSYAVAETIHSAVMSQFSVLKQWIRDQIRIVRRTGECFSYWDGMQAHRRDMFDIADQNDETRATAEHVAINHPIQGSAALYTLISLNQIDGWFEDDHVPAAIMNTVHDDIMIEAREDVAQEVMQTAGEIMESQPADGLPLVVDRKVGKSWGSLVEPSEFFSERVRQQA